MQHRANQKLLVFLRTALGDYSDALDYFLYNPKQDHRPQPQPVSTAPLQEEQEIEQEVEIKTEKNTVFKLTLEYLPMPQIKFELPKTKMRAEKVLAVQIPATFELYKSSGTIRQVAEELLHYLQQQIVDPSNVSNLEAILLSGKINKNVGCMNALMFIAACEDPALSLQLVTLLNKLSPDLLELTLLTIGTQKNYGYTFFMHLCRAEKPELVAEVFKWLKLPCWSKPQICGTVAVYSRYRG